MHANVTFQFCFDFYANSHFSNESQVFHKGRKEGCLSPRCERRGLMTLRMSYDREYVFFHDCFCISVTPVFFFLFFFTLTAKRARVATDQGRKGFLKKKKVEGDEMNDETDEVLIRISLCWDSVGTLHFISPLYPPPLDDGQPPRVPCCVAFSIM